MGAPVAVIGASGYAGGELLRLLAGHPELSVEYAVANRYAGQPVAEVHPHLAGAPEWRFDRLEDADLDRVDLVFTAMPHGESAGLVAGIGARCRVVDLGADFRLADPQAWQRYYGSGHAGVWTYGLPELPGARARIGAAHRVANPGCYAAAAILGFAPLLAYRLIDPDRVLSVVAASGVSGAGRTPAPRLLAAEVLGDVTAYKVAGAHQHIPEIRQVLGGLAGTEPPLSFTPLLAPMPRGILAVCTADAHPGVGDAEVREALAAAYAGEPFVRLLPAGQWPRTAATAGSNLALVQGAVEPDTGRVVVIVAIDNLGKGAAGTAVQNANLMLGLPETAGLPRAGIAP